VRADPSPDSLLVAQALMTHFPASLDMEAFGNVAYKLRNMDADMHSYFQQVIESINESVASINSRTNGASRSGCARHAVTTSPANSRMVATAARARGGG
jgi:hypothetical protein